MNDGSPRRLKPGRGEGPGDPGPCVVTVAWSHASGLPIIATGNLLRGGEGDDDGDVTGGIQPRHLGSDHIGRTRPAFFDRNHLAFPGAPDDDPAVMAGAERRQQGSRPTRPVTG